MKRILTSAFAMLLLYCSSAVSQFSNDTLWEKPLNIERITGVMYSPDNKYLAVVGYDNSNDLSFKPILLDPLTGLLLKELNEDLNRGSLFGAFSHDSKYFAFSAYYYPDNILRIWDIEKNDALIRIPMQNGDYTSTSAWVGAGFTMDGKYLWANINNANAKLDDWDRIVVFDTETWQIIKSIKHIEGGKVIPSKDGKIIGILTFSQAIHIYDAQTMELVRNFNSEKDITDFAFSPDGKYIAATLENTIYLWSLETGELVKEFHKDGVSYYMAICFSHDSKYIIVGVTYDDLTWETLVYNIEQDSITHSYPKLASYSIALSNDSKYLAIGGSRLIIYYAKWGETGIIDDNPVEEVIYPNPSNGMVNINLSIKKSEKLSVSIYNEAGILIENIFESIAEPGLIIQWDCSKQPAGMYLCRVEGTNINKTIKIIKK